MWVVVHECGLWSICSLCSVFRTKKKFQFVWFWNIAFTLRQRMLSFYLMMEYIQIHTSTLKQNWFRTESKDILYSHDWIMFGQIFKRSRFNWLPSPYVLREDARRSRISVSSVPLQSLIGWTLIHNKHSKIIWQQFWIVWRRDVWSGLQITDCLVSYIGLELGVTSRTAWLSLSVTAVTEIWLQRTYQRHVRHVSIYLGAAEIMLFMWTGFTDLTVHLPNSLEFVIIRIYLRISPLFPGIVIWLRWWVSQFVLEYSLGLSHSPVAFFFCALWSTFFWCVEGTCA